MAAEKTKKKPTKPEAEPGATKAMIKAALKKFVGGMSK